MFILPNYILGINMTVINFLINWSLSILHTTGADVFLTNKNSFVLEKSP
jgi:hypothetical protein